MLDHLSPGQAPQGGTTLLRGSAVFGPTGRTGLGKTSVYAMMRTGEFPRPVAISERAVAWKSDDIDNWINSRSVAVAGGGK